jgi:3-hydroxyisobutyrate dehydrogenase-like beta-hydroxyacid dehydrogenase
MEPVVRMIGFGEAAMAFAGDDARGIWAVCAFDSKTDEPGQWAQKRADYDRMDVDGAATLGDALAGGSLILSLVTAGQALAAARQAARVLSSGALYLDMNSVAPATKQAAAAVIGAAGGQYVDVAVMAPVHPARRAAPLLVSGPAAGEAAAALATLGFTDVTVVGDAVGQASAIKMIRSVMIKGLEALAAECAVAAHRAGVLDEVLASLGSEWPGNIAYRLERMTSHGRRRAEEMAEVSATLRALGVAPAMASATQGWQQRLGALDIPAAADAATRLAAIDHGLARETDNGASRGKDAA